MGERHEPSAGRCNQCILTSDMSISNISKAAKAHIVLLLLIISRTVNSIELNRAFGETREFLQAMKGAVSMRARPLNHSAVEITCQEDVNQRIKLDHLNLPHFLDDAKVIIKYNPLYATLVVYSLPRELCSSGYSPIPINSHDPALDVENCKSYMFAFRHQHFSGNILNSTLFSHCEPKTITKTLKEAIAHKVVVKDLLPHVIYDFSYSVMSDWFNITTEPEIFSRVCMPDAGPLYPPDTDLGAFTLHEPTSNGLVGVDLYWRPVPLMLKASASLHYQIECRNETGHMVVKFRERDHGTGLLRIDKPMNQTYRCSIYSDNTKNRSAESTIIEIPKIATNVQAPRKFEAYVYSPSTFEFVLKWQDVNRLASMESNLNATSTAIRLDLVYTVYWCLVLPNSGCASLMGMATTTNTTYALDLITGEHNNLKFGVSYRTRDGLISSGIVWSQCVYYPETKQTGHEIANPYDILATSSHNRGQPTIKVRWKTRGCVSQIAMIDHFEILYCPIGVYDPCDPYEKFMIKQEPKDMPSGKCHLISLVNHLDHELIITELLEHSVYYMIQMRFVVLNGIGEYSNYIIEHTLPDVKITKTCGMGSLGNILIATLATFVVLLIILWRFRKTIFHYHNLVRRYCGSISGVQERVLKTTETFDGESTQLDMKFWAKFETGSRHSEDNQSDRQPTAESVGENYVSQAQMMGEMPEDDNYAMMLYKEEERAPSFSSDRESEYSGLDDASFSSHTSFLDTLLDKKTDSTSSMC